MSTAARVASLPSLTPHSLPFALLISPLDNVVRSDGTKIVMSERLSTKQEFKKIKVTMTSKLIVLSALWALWSFFYSGTWVRAARQDDKQRLTRHRARISAPTLPSASGPSRRWCHPSSACVLTPRPSSRSRLY